MKILIDMNLSPSIAVVWNDHDITAMFAYFLTGKGYVVKLA